jgi:phosphatidylglycerol:prolipoprotein diacylglycerol transferase
MAPPEIGYDTLYGERISDRKVDVSAIRCHFNQTMLLAIPFPDLSPTLIEIPLGPITLPIRWYALAYIAGIILGVWMAGRALARPALWHNETPPMTKERLEDFTTWLIIGIILGGRVGYVLFYEPAYFLENPGDILRVWTGGMAFHGGFLGVLVAGLIFSRKHRISIPKLADLAALCTAPGLLFGRVANFINAELWGRPTDAPWGVIFPGVRAQDCPDIVGPCARHPSQLYEAGLEGLVLGVILVWLAFTRGWLRTPGAICGFFLAGYGAARFFVEFYRVADAQYITPDNPLGRVLFVGDFGLSMGQILSTPMILIGLAFIVLARRRA